MRFALLAILVTAACDGGPPEPTAPFTHPEDFVRDGCVPGGFRDHHLAGIYAMRVDRGGYNAQTLALRIDELDGGSLGGVFGGVDADVVYRYGDDDVILSATVDGEVLGFDLCAQTDAGIFGSFMDCWSDRDPPCTSEPVFGRLVRRLDEPDAVGMTELGEIGADWTHDFVHGGTVNVRVVDQIAYLARYQDGLRIVDVHDPAHPVELGHVATEEPTHDEIYNDVKIVDGPDAHRYALMASSYLGVVVIDVTDPRAPAIRGRFPDGLHNVHTLFVDGGRAYLANAGVGLDIWDIADPLLPVELGTFEGSPTFVHDLYVSGDRAYLDQWDDGLAIVDVSDPAAPVELGRFADYGAEHSNHSSWVTHVGDRDVAITGDEEYGSHVHVVDVTEGTPAFGTEIGEWMTRPEVSVHNLMAMGNLAIMAYYQDGVRVLDLADPAAPVEVAHFDTWPGYDPDYGDSFLEGACGIDVDVASRTVYVADTHRGLIVLHLDGQ